MSPEVTTSWPQLIRYAVLAYSETVIYLNSLSLDLLARGAGTRDADERSRSDGA